MMSLTFVRTINQCQDKGNYSQRPDLESGITNVIVAAQLVPVVHAQLDAEWSLIAANLEKQLLFKDRIEGVSNHSCTKDLFSKGTNDEGVHIPAHTRH